MDINEEIGSYEAKSKLPEILRRVASGHRYTITNHGKAVADLIPTQSTDHRKTKSAIKNILKMKKPVVSESDLVSMKEQGRR